MMIKPLKLILAACIVEFGLIFVQPYNQFGDQENISNIDDGTKIQRNFQNLFNSIAKNNSKKSKLSFKTLQHEVLRKLYTFDAMKEELQIAQNKNAYKKRNFFKRNKYYKYFVANKREANNQDQNSDLNYAKNPPFYRVYPPFFHQNSADKACIADVGAITKGQHRFYGPDCQIFYCPPDPSVEEITVIECDDYINKTNLPENFPDTEERMYLKICEYCKPTSPTIDLDLMTHSDWTHDNTTPLAEEEESTTVLTNTSSTSATITNKQAEDEKTDLP